MKNKLKMMILAVLTISLVLTMGGCDIPRRDDKKKGSETAQEEAKSRKDAGEQYKGVLTRATDTTIVLKGRDGKKAFFIDDDTEYDLGKIDDLYVGDKIKVTYHTDGEDHYADAVKLVKHRKGALHFSGRVTAHDAKAVTVKGKKQTVLFAIDHETKISGSLSKGDKVRITYDGELDEFPYAKRIRITKESGKSEQHEVIGLVSSVSDTEMVLAIDAKTTCRFKITDRTRITGKADKVRKGDAVLVKFDGDLDGSPEALKININRVGKKLGGTIRGKIIKVTKDSVTLRADKKTYTFRIDKNTKYTGIKMKKGCEASITYIGSLSGNPKAGTIACSKGRKTAKKDDKKDKVKKSGKKEKVKKSKSKKTTPKKTKPKKDKPKKTEPKKTKPKKDKPKKDKPKKEQPAKEKVISASGTVISGNVEKQTVRIKLEDNTEIVLKTDKNTSISGGYFPEKGDTIRIKYVKDSKLLKEILFVNEADDTDSEGE